MWKTSSNLKFCGVVQNVQLLCFFLVASQLTRSFTGTGIVAAQSNSSLRSFRDESLTFGSKSTFQSNSGCWPNPKIDVSFQVEFPEDGDDEDELITAPKNKPFVFRGTTEGFSIDCVAPYPIEWRPSSLLLQRTQLFHEFHASRYLANQSKLQQFYSSNNSNNNNQNHVENLGRDSTAKYFIGAPGRFKIKNYRKIKTLEHGEEFLIPCPLINPRISSWLQNTRNVRLRLVRILNEGLSNATFHPIKARYDPDAGFYMTETPIGMDKLVGTFRCQVEFDSTLENKNLNETQSGTKTWSVREAVTFELIQNEANEQNSTQEEEEKEENWIDVTFEDRQFKSKKTVDRTVKIVVSTTKIQCYIEKLEFCVSATDEERGIPCTKGDNSCRKIRVSPRVGMFLCTFGERAAYAYSFSGLDGQQIYLNTVNGEIPPKSALIQMTIQFPDSGKDRKREGPILNSTVGSWHHNLFTDETYTFTCTAVEFLFTGYLIFLVEYKNGSRVHFPKESVFELDGSQNPTIQTRLNLTLDMTRVVCLAPWSNSSEWMETSIDFTLREVSSPKIQLQTQAQRRDERNETVEEKHFYIGDKDKNLKCTARGEPLPDFKWTWENGTEIPTGKGSAFFVQFPKEFTTLQFPTIDKSFEGVYVCEARNEFGTARHKFHVKVKVRDSNSNLGLGVGEISGIVIAVLIVLAAFGLISYKYFQTRKELRNLTADEIDEFQKGKPEELKNTEIQGENVHLLPFDKQYEVSDSDYSIDQDKILGSGEFGVVYGGKLGHLPVAIKTTKSTADVDFFKAFLKELKVMTFIGKHPNVVQLLGTSTNKIRQRIVYVIVELGAHGSLYSFLKDNENGFVDTISSSQLFNISPEKMPSVSTGYQNVVQTSEIKITTMDFVKWCGQVAAGMSHLASKKIIHRDLAARNVLLFDDYTAKITDFGLSRQLYTSTNYVRKNQTPLPWRGMAPESLKHLTFSTKSDVWSFGVLAWEIFSLAAVPFSGLSWTQEFLDHLEQGKRLEKPHRASNEIYENMCLCWHPVPKNRPEFDQLQKFYNDQLKTETIYLTLA